MRYLITRADLRYLAVGALLAVAALIALVLVPSPSLVLAAAAAADVSTVVDFSALVPMVLQFVLIIIVILAYWVLSRYVKDAAARQTILTAVANGVKFGINKVEGAVPGKVLSVNVGSAVAAQALQYALGAVPAAIGRFGLSNDALAKLVWAHLPAVDGPVNDATLNQVIAAATGAAGTAPSQADLLAIIGPALEAALDAFLAKQRAAPQA